MESAVPHGARPLVGRAGELTALVNLVRRAGTRRPGAVLVTGDAGVGKTALVREVCTVTADEAELLWAPCLPLVSLAVPFLPLTTSLRRWGARGEGVPVLDRNEGRSVADVVMGFDGWLEGTCRHRPVLLVVDDLQWADLSTLDILMYVLAGLADRRLAVILTLRSGALGEGHVLWRWLADVRRLPSVEELRLGRLDRLATAEQIAGLLGRVPPEMLVDDVFDRSLGNAYWTSLLVRQLPADGALPADLPSDLNDAVKRDWHRLSPPARQLTRLLAVAGRPQGAERLHEVAEVAGAGDAVVPMLHDVVPVLREAVDAGVLSVGAEARYWFAHPLVAEVLRDDLLPDERRILHAAFAAVIDPPDAAVAEVDVERSVDLADHHYGAGNADRAFAWALRAADAADGVGSAAEALRLLRRALELWPRAGDTASRADVLARVQAAAERAGELEVELAAVTEQLTLVDRDRHPLRAAALLVRRMVLRHSTGGKFADLDDVRAAVRLSAAQPDSPEHALAVAELAHAELWHGLPSGAASAEKAVRLARRSRSARAMSYALTAQVMARTLAGDIDVLAEALQAQAAAAEAKDFWAFGHATVWGANSLETRALTDVVEHLRRGRERLSVLGSPHAYIAFLAATEASLLLQLGDWQGCTDRLRLALGAKPGAMPGAIARLVAALLACRQGRLAEAQDHLTRAEELFAELPVFRGLFFDAVRAELAVAAGDTDRAVAAAQHGIAEQPPPVGVERLLPLAARAIADHAQSRRDRGDDGASAQVRLRQLRQQHPKVSAEAATTPMYLDQVRAMQAWYDAEIARGLADGDAGVRWQQAADRCRTAQLPWDEAYACWRAAEALLPTRKGRQAGTEALRRAHELALDLGALLLQTDVEALASDAHVTLTGVPPVPVDDSATLPGLTAREREILRHVMAGRTYGEIARTLVLSKKTVSVHVSNMLRKTGAANRLALVQLARRRISTR